MTVENAGQTPEQKAEQEANPKGSQTAEERAATLEKELATLQGRYQESSKEGQRLAAELRERSLKQTEKPQGFVPEGDFVKAWVDRGLTEDAARLMYLHQAESFQDRQRTQQQLKEMENVIRFQADQANRLAVEGNPQIKEAVAFFKDDALLSQLPPAEQLERFQKWIVPASGGGKRDLTAIKAAAGGPTGGKARQASSGSEPDGERETLAKAYGYPNAKAMEEFRDCHTEAQAKEWKSKYRPDKK